MSGSALDALILEAPYTTMADAVANNRLAKVSAGFSLAAAPQGVDTPN